MATWISILELPTGRRIFVLNQALESAAAIKDKSAKTAFVADLKGWLELNQEAAKLEQQWARQKGGEVPVAETLLAADNALDAAMGGFNQTALQSLKLSTRPQKLRTETQAMLLDVFPQGVQAITSLDLPGEVVAGRAIVAKLKGDWGSTIKAAGLTEWAAELESSLATLDARLKARSAKGMKLEWSEVAAAQGRGQQTLRQYVATVVGSWKTDSEADVKMRHLFLAPLAEQQDAIRADLRRSRGASDVTAEGTPVPPNPPVAMPVSPG